MTVGRATPGAVGADDGGGLEQGAEFSEDTSPGVGSVNVRSDGRREAGQNGEVQPLSNGPRDATDECEEDGKGEGSVETGCDVGALSAAVKSEEPIDMRLLSATAMEGAVRSTDGVWEEDMI